MTELNVFLKNDINHKMEMEMIIMKLYIIERIVSFDTNPASLISSMYYQTKQIEYYFTFLVNKTAKFILF